MCINADLLEIIARGSSRSDVNWSDPSWIGTGPRLSSRALETRSPPASEGPMCCSWRLSRPPVGSCARTEIWLKC